MEVTSYGKAIPRRDCILITFLQFQLIGVVEEKGFSWSPR